jgi:death-on-curing protein
VLSTTESISERVTEHAFDKRSAQFSSLGIDSPETFNAHIAEVLEGEETQCFTAFSGTQRQADYYYDEATNTAVIVPANEEYEPTAYRPKEGWFQDRIDEESHRLGVTIEPERGGIYALKNIPREQEKPSLGDNPPEVEGRDISGGEPQAADIQEEPQIEGPIVGDQPPEVEGRDRMADEPQQVAVEEPPATATDRPEPKFLSRAVLDSINDLQAESHGGEPGVRDDKAVDDLLEKAETTYHDNPEADLYDVAGVYVSGLANQQPYADMNEHTAAEAGIVFMEANGIDTSRLPEETMYQAVEAAANQEVDAQQVAEQFREAMPPPEQAIQPDAPEISQLEQTVQRDTQQQEQHDMGELER